MVKKTENGGQIRITKTLRKMLDAAAVKEDISVAEFCRRRIAEEIAGNTLANYTPYKWTVRPLSVVPGFRITPRMSAGIDDRMEYLHAHPNNKGWTVNSWSDYMRAIIETAVGIEQMAARTKARAEKAHQAKQGTTELESKKTEA